VAPIESRRLLRRSMGPPVIEALLVGDLVTAGRPLMAGSSTVMRSLIPHSSHESNSQRFRKTLLHETTC